MRRVPAVIAFVISTVVLSHVALVAQSRGATGVEGTRFKGFLITLVLGDTQGTSSGALTPAEAKALADMKDFLPYKNYRAIDTAPIIGANAPNITLRGLDGQKYEFLMQSTLAAPSVTKVDMLRLWDIGAPGKPKPATILIDTSFRIEAGETVVVGTSRLEGTQALLLLVTAVAK